LLLGQLEAAEREAVVVEAEVEGRRLGRPVPGEAAGVVGLARRQGRLRARSGQADRQRAGDHGVPDRGDVGHELRLTEPLGAGATLARMSSSEHRITVVGAGMAGSEAALAAVAVGVSVDLFEMRPTKLTPAHSTGSFAEMVCSNSFGGEGRSNAKGL